MKYKRKLHLFEVHPEYLLIYQGLLKDERIWSNSGQYYMARECDRRAKCLLNENITDYDKITHTEELYCPTRKCN